MNILFTTRLPQEGFTSLDEIHYDLIMPSAPCFTEEELCRLLPDADILVATYDYPVKASMLQCAERLRLIANFGVGYNNIDVVWAASHHILVTNTPDPVIEPTAEHAFALMHTLAHRTAELDRKLRMHDSPVRFGVMNNLGVSLYGKQLGIIGMGRIGQALARRAVAAGMTIVYHNRHMLPETIEQRYNAKYADLTTLLRESDYVSLNLPYTSEVHHLINAQTLQLMKPTALLINTARGAHVDEKALIEALENKQIAGAALDVYEHEPRISEALKQLDNVVLSPHVGTGTWEGRLAMCRNVCDNILAFESRCIENMNIVS
ncbi:MAG TPA: dihydrofolate reductase [Bacteroidales bacterium]|nr:dihydrofolate reductase [Bacteroidales bacterium]